MTDWILIALAGLTLLLLAWLALRRPDPLALERLDRLERELRDELGRQGQVTRGDLATFQQMLLAQSGEDARDLAQT